MRDCEKMESLKHRYRKSKAPASMAGGPGPGPGGPGPGGPGPGGQGKRMALMGKGRKPANSRATIARLLSYLREDRGRMALAFVCVILNTVGTLLGAYMLRPIINTYIVPVDGSAGDPAGLLRALGVMAAVYLVGVGASYLQARIMLTVAQRALKRIRNDLFGKMQELPVRFYDTNSNGDLMSRFTNDVDTIGQMLSSTLVQLFAGMLSIVGTLVLMVYTNLWLTLVTVVMIPVMMKAGGAVAGWSQKYFSEQQASLGTLNGYIEEMITGQKVVKVFCHEDVVREEFALLNQDLRRNQIRAQFFGGIMGPVMGNLSQVNYSLTACIGGLLCIFRNFDVGGLTVFLNFSRQFSRPINELSMQVTSVFSALAGAERVFGVMDEKPEEPDPADAVVLNPMKGHVVLDHVTFGYDPDKVILRDISLYARPGQKIAFVGSTGAGKTTITNLINRFYDIQGGTITVDGVDIRHMSRNNLRQNIAMVLQDTHLFTGTVMENIRYGRLDATDGEVVQAAKTASAHSFIMRLPQGYQTMLEGDGANLSQGQRQLLNIARAALSKAPVLILDEATSSVDTRTEKHIEHGMDRLMADRTTLVIAHRLSTVRNANAIMVLEQGQIIERGDHEELLAMKGRYYELYTGMKELE
ncbi:MAG: ABC transporter ATP-binding protein [Lachnospiraceae bacterium]|jgi:ATP-binding cassette subfamily B multidrug efflux pump|nr:ABC transporter ATP-binding protein [Lachnospiraceae bacterium]